MEEYSGYVGLDGHKETISPALANPPGARTTNSQRGMSPKRPRDPRFFLAWMTSLAHQTSSSVFAVSNSPVPGLLALKKNPTEKPHDSSDKCDDDFHAANFTPPFARE